MEIEKYKKELESAIYEGIPDGTFYIGGKVVEKVLKDAINEVLVISRVPRWVACKDAMPDLKTNGFSKWVLACDSAGYIFKSRYDYKYEQWMDKANVPDSKITHWTPLPEPPS